MKEKIKSIFGVILNVTLAIVAISLGADSAFAMSVVTEVNPGLGEEVKGPEGTTIPNPAEGKTDDKGLETQLQGKTATATHVTASGFEEDEIDKMIAQFRPYRFPLEYDITMNAQQQAVKSYHPIHYRSGSSNLEAVYNGSPKAETKTGNVHSYVIAIGDVTNPECLTEYSTVYAPTMKGYEDEVEDGVMALFVTEVGTENITLRILNPKASAQPSLATSTKLIVGSTAGSESQMIVDPDNYQPVPVEVYLQKKLSNIVFTDEWLETAKKVPFIEKDLRNNALYDFKRRNARTHWLGKKTRITVKVKEGKLGDQYVYFEEGILRQIPMFYQYVGKKLTFADLNALSKMQFAKDSANNTARVYCGKNAIEMLLNIDVTIHKEIKFEAVTEAGMTIQRWKNNFGTLDFVHDPTLDDIGYEDFMVVVDIQNAVHYVKRAQREETQDMKQGTGEVHEAKRDIFSLIDCIALKGYNAILVGPSDALPIAAGLGGIESFYSVESSLKSVLSPTPGQVVYLTADEDNYKKDHIYEYDAETKTWKDYEGGITE